MMKIKFIFLNAFIIVFISATSVFAAEVKKPLPPPAPAKAVPPATAVQAQTKVPPAPAAAKAPVPAPSKPAAVAVPAQPATAANAPAQPVAAANATAVTAPVETYSYNPVGKPDPFRPLVVPETAEQKKAKTEKKAPPPSIFPLQRAEADKYKVVGIAGDENHRVAIAEDSAKKFYPLLIGTRIGLRNGKVVEIMADRVIVEEYEGKKTKRVILKLRKN